MKFVAFEHRSYERAYLVYESAHKIGTVVKRADGHWSACSPTGWEGTDFYAPRCSQSPAEVWNRQPERKEAMSDTESWTASRMVEITRDGKRHDITENILALVAERDRYHTLLKEARNLIAETNPCDDEGFYDDFVWAVLKRIDATLDGMV